MSASARAWRRRESLAWILLLVINVLTHFSALGERAMGHDESLHAYYSHAYADTGAYKHDPMLHGPLLFHATAAVFLTLGTNDTTARLLPALSGVALVAALFFFRRYLGRLGAFFAALLLSLSPTLLFYGRYLRNDIWVALFAVCWLLGAWRFQDTRQPRWLALMSVGMTLSFCAKETSFITGATFGAWFVSAALVESVRRRSGWRESRNREIALFMLTLVLPYASPLVHVALGWDPTDFTSAPAQARAALVAGVAFVLSLLLAFFGLRRKPLGLGLWARLMALFWIFPVCLHSALFTDLPRGLVSGLIGSLGYWLGQHAVGRGSQPWFYYLLLTALYEFLPWILAMLAGLAVLGRAFRREEVRVPALLLFWMVASFVLYSAAGERMPWLLVHIVLPMALLGGWWLGCFVSRIDASQLGLRELGVFAVVPVAILLAARLMWLRPFEGRELEALGEAGLLLTLVVFAAALGALVRACGRGLRRRQALRLSVLGGFGLLAFFTARAAFTLTFVNYDLATELLVYSHGTPDVKRALAEIEDVAERTGVGHDLVVAADDDTAWPMTWYLRDYPKQAFYGDAPTADAMRSPVVIVGSKNLAVAEPYLEDDYVRRDYRLIWWPIEDYAGLDVQSVWAALADREARRRVWEIVVHRRYPGVSLAEWPYRHEFKLFIRRDLVRQVWPLNLEALVLDERGVSQKVDLPRVACPVLAVYAGNHAGQPLKAPSAAAMTSEGLRLIADTGNGRILVFDEAGTLVRAFGSACELSKGAAGGCEDPDAAGPLSRGDGQFAEPWGIAAGPDGEIVVADTWNGRIQSFDRRGRFLRAWGRLVMNAPLPIPPDDLYGPRGLAYDSARRRLYVADTGNKRVLVLSRDGGVLGELHGGGDGPSRFDEPVGVAVSPRDGHVFVADTWNRRIQHFDADLEFVASWPVPGWVGRGLANKPYLAVDLRGNVYASDPEQGRVLVFAPGGRPLLSLQATAWEGSRMSRPTGLVLDPKANTLLVADPATDQVFVLPQVTNPDSPGACSLQH
jgi:uncharacterized protein (TIGR03663 family)